MPKVLEFQPSISVKSLREVEPGYFLGTMYIEGVEHHFEMIEVVADTQTGEQHPHGGRDLDNFQRYDDMQMAYDGIYQTVDFDGRTFVCRVHPYCQ